MLYGGLIAMGRQIYLPDQKTLKEEVLRETHESRFATHPRSTNMYKVMFDQNNNSKGP